MKKDGTIRGEAILEKLAPELVKIFNFIPRTGIADIKIATENHRITAVVYKYLNQKKDAGL